MKLYFENSNGNRRLIAELNTYEEVNREIYRFCKDRNFKIYYTRCWKNDDGLTVYDVGSHTECFLLDDK